MRKTEGRLVFEFRTALQVEQFEVEAQPLKCADFVITESDATWMIEVTEAVKAPDDERRKALAELLGQMTSGKLMKDMLMKLYGTHAHLALAGVMPTKKVFFCVVIGVPPLADDAAQRNRMRDEMKRVTDRIGPSFFGTANRPIIKVESVDTWNSTNSGVRIA